jgi:hypothetical protein
VPLNLLVVDSDRFVREACKEAAALLGYRTTATGSAEQAFWLIDSQSVDVVLLDLNLPGAGGLEVMGQIKRLQPDRKSGTKEIETDCIGWWTNSTVADASFGGSSAYFVNQHGTRFQIGAIRGRGPLREWRTQAFFISSKPHLQA